MKNLVETIVAALVDNEEEIFVRINEGSITDIIEIRVAKEDIGKIIGQKGRIADAIRVIIMSAARRANRKVVLQILD